jgi:hypothetical protein
LSDHFASFYAAVNQEWPAFGQEESERVVQERRWRDTFSGFTSDDLRHAMKEALAHCKKRPKPAELLDWAKEHARGNRRFTPKAEPHWTLCSCGCGGKRWELILRDPTTKQVRFYPKQSNALLDAMPNQITRNPRVLQGMAHLCDQPMTRAKVECRKTGDGAPPEGSYVGLSDEGIPVHDVKPEETYA